MCSLNSSNKFNTTSFIGCSTEVLASRQCETDSMHEIPDENY